MVCGFCGWWVAWQLPVRYNRNWACGLLGSIIAFRWDELICDDLCTQGNTQTDYLRDQAWAWWEQTLLTRMAPNGRVVYIGTRWHEDDIPARLMQQTKPNGKPVWSRDYLTVADGDTSYYELSFRSESRPVGRDNPRKYHMWSGTISVEGAELAHISGIGLENRIFDDVALDPSDPNSAHFETATRGQKRSIILKLDSRGKDARVEVSLEPNVEQGSGASITA